MFLLIFTFVSLTFSIAFGQYDIGDTISSDYQSVEFNFCYPADSSGSTFSFAEHSGKVIILDMAASW